MKSKWFVFLLVGVFAVSFVGGCAPPAVDNDDNEVGEVATQYRIGGLVMMDNLNMSPGSLQYTNMGCLYLMIVYENLAYYSKLDGDPPQSGYDFVPKLATGYDVSYEQGNQVWTIALREGVTWHDGEDFTADDVVYTMKYASYMWSADRPVDWEAVEEDAGWEDIWPEHVLVEADGPHKVRMTYIDGWHQPEDYIPSWWTWTPIVPEHVFGPDGEGVYDGWHEDPAMWDGESIGTGPFMLKEFEADEHALFERYEDYWGPKPSAETILFRVFGDPGSMFTALEAGAIDTHDGWSVPFPKIGLYQADPDIEVSFNKDISIYYMGLNLHPTEGYGPLQDKALRQAVAYAIDSEDIVDMVFGGYGEVPTGFIYKESPNHNPALPDYSFDQAKAGDILEDAGYSKEDGYWHTPEGERISFKLTTVPGVSDSMALMITSNLQDFGLDVTYEVIDSGTFFQYLYMPDLEGAMQAFIASEDPSVDPWSDWIWAMLSDPYFWGYQWNPAWYDNPEFNDLYIANYVADDLYEKREILFRMQEILAEDLPIIYLARPDFISAHRTDRWENWYDTLGGPVSWINEYSIREVTPK